mgnify:CR=1 FL=1
MSKTRRWARVLECLTCQERFVSSAYQARYCSSRCRRTMNQRTTRKNARAKMQQQARAHHRYELGKREGIYASADISSVKPSSSNEVGAGRLTL